MTPRLRGPTAEARDVFPDDGLGARLSAMEKSSDPGRGSGDNIVIAASDWAKLFCMFELRGPNQGRRAGSDLPPEVRVDPRARGKGCARPRGRERDLLGKRPKGRSGADGLVTELTVITLLFPSGALPIDASDRRPPT